MPIIILKTQINAPIQICFDLARSIDLHQISTARSKESVVGDITKGLIGAGDFVTWEATHFGVRQRLTSRITHFERPTYFQDIQINGAFKRFAHDHLFQTIDKYVVMTDTFEFESPLGILGRVFNTFVLTKYMRNLLAERNAIIKEYAESSKWKAILPDSI